MFFLYQIILSLLILISPILIIFRVYKGKEDKTRFKEKFSIPSKKRSKGKIIWFHGASVGEILSIIPLIENYEKDKLINQILVTSCTLSSSKVLKKFKFKKTVHQFYPIDHFFFTKKFLEYWKPNLAIFIDSEIWPNMFKKLEEKKISLILLNARITKKTFLKWQSLKNVSQKVFKKISVAYPQNLETKYFLKKLKVKKIKTIGNLKYAEQDNEIKNKLNLKFKSKKIWVASSTHSDEEIFCGKTHIELKKKIKNLLTILIPRHIHRVNEIKSELENLRLNVTNHSSNVKKLKNIDIYIVDTFGETKKFHKVGTSVFIGGSIINRGGQNPLEAARYGARILHGPNIDNFKDVYKTLSNLKISKKITTPRELASTIIFKRNKKLGDKIKKIGVKILKETINDLDKLIKNEFKKT
ncbi:glycosyltransferase N-terminal domain-containing protein [Candidatus Pelagibacter sp.]|nr:3-deoxy-D-manno-octulosonic acid transferase [Candidatus Pelagibacter bacterium]MDC0901194.1 glycosyltransferase N-terminal domain-containing protein [Candidatus Pelagibacter sp.]MDC1069703.1 glycosyltransferase N-terminal domain-containing protein [Candidatus Pelagibacter sp.]